MDSESAKEAGKNATPGPAGGTVAGRWDVQLAAGVLAVLGLAYIVFGMPIKGVIILLASAGCVGTVFVARRRGRRRKESKSRPGRRSRKKRRRR
jgi:hypothetical protein